MRGLSSCAARARFSARYNPAYAGTIHRRDQPSSRVTIQPRVCGDYALFALGVVAAKDTTPRMRGLSAPWPDRPRCTGYNPAYAGTIQEKEQRMARASIQPRVCGDYGAAREKVGRIYDTTPRMRGLLAS